MPSSQVFRRALGSHGLPSVPNPSETLHGVTHSGGLDRAVGRRLPDAMSDLGTNLPVYWEQVWLVMVVAEAPEMLEILERIDTEPRTIES